MCVKEMYLVAKCIKKFLIKVVFVLIAAPPNWVQKISDAHVTIEESAFWECKANGRPKPSYSWLKDGEPLIPQVQELLVSFVFRVWGLP